MIDNDNIAIMMSTAVSIVSIISATIISIYQQRNQRETKSMEMYFEKKFKAYTDFFQLSRKLDFNNPTDFEINEVVTAAKIASILSPLPIAEIINKFSFLLLLSNCYDAPDAINLDDARKDAYTALNAAEDAMRMELMQYDLLNKKHLKKLQRLMKKMDKECTY